MEQENNSTIKLAALALIGFGVAARLLPHPANFAPITAMALFGGAYLPKKYAFIIPLAAMVISDYFIGFYGTTMFYVYGSFVLSGLIGLWLRSHKNAGTILGGSLMASILFFLITNYGVWANPHSWYPHNFVGLMQSYTMGLPFFRNTLLGDMGYTAVFFGAYEAAKNLGKMYLPARIYQLAF